MILISIEYIAIPWISIEYCWFNKMEDVDDLMIGRTAATSIDDDQQPIYYDDIPEIVPYEEYDHSRVSVAYLYLCILFYWHWNLLKKGYLYFNIIWNVIIFAQFIDYYLGYIVLNYRGNFWIKQKASFK